MLSLSAATGPCQPIPTLLHRLVEPHRVLPGLRGGAVDGIWSTLLGLLLPELVDGGEQFV